MCGYIEWSDDRREKSLDTPPSQAYIWAVKAAHLELGADEVFQLRVRLKMTQRQFADLVGVDPITVSRWERAVTRVQRPMVTHIRTTVAEYKRGRG